MAFRTDRSQANDSIEKQKLKIEKRKDKKEQPMITDKLIEKIIEMQNPTCVGLDTLFDYLPDEMKAGATTFEDAAERVFEFNKKIIDTVYDIVPSVKVQIAYYEMYGVAGMKAYEETLKYAAEKGLVVIADAKRNDIGSTASCYAKTFLGETEL